jgi:flagellar hook protein FlgE
MEASHHSPRAEASDMSLASVLQTALSGMSAASVSVETVSHNLANMRTNGFKASRPIFATQSPATHTSDGNPLQVGTGVQVVGFAVDNSQGPLVADPDGEGVIELSNTDVGEELVELILAENQFAANAVVFGTANSLLDELIHVSR